MLNREKHQLLMGKILKDIYSDISIAPLLGFKGGTAAYLFYGLPRFSVALDFDLLTDKTESRETVFEKFRAVAGKYGTVRNDFIKKSTVFMMLSYGDTDHNIKLEVSVRPLPGNFRRYYEPREYLGIPMLVAKQDYLFAGKLAALALRKETAARDIYDTYFFASKNSGINAEIIQSFTGKTVKEYLKDCIRSVERIGGNRILQGLGELLGEKEKQWVKQNLKSETVFMLKNYQSVLKR